MSLSSESEGTDYSTKIHSLRAFEIEMGILVSNLFSCYCNSTTTYDNSPI